MWWGSLATFDTCLLCSPVNPAWKEELGAFVSASCWEPTLLQITEVSKDEILVKNGMKCITSEIENVHLWPDTELGQFVRQIADFKVVILFFLKEGCRILMKVVFFDMHFLLQVSHITSGFLRCLFLWLFVHPRQLFYFWPPNASHSSGACSNPTSHHLNGAYHSMGEHLCLALSRVACQPVYIVSPAGIAPRFLIWGWSGAMKEMYPSGMINSVWTGFEPFQHTSVSCLETTALDHSFQPCFLKYLLPYVANPPANLYEITAVQPISLKIHHHSYHHKIL